ncbi:rhodanese-like domain-containing protein [Alcaligenes parafaecalis]|uniref:Rhodanese-like domain-containing protein n=1 Tax=Alcaligenes parafaecalis TaxID=171260 RepID=A0ABT3VM82_9BURK|nr:rhodanese-like domain-containing protein [Alcaligenes parafaecalis]MCX5464247.1 rhodanese-like domain-containing protein [Alcaligenes parafaecalis]
MLLIPSFFKGRAGRAVSSAEAVQMVNQKDAILIDLRSADQFKAGAIAQSRNIPAADLDAKASSLPKDKPVILVCDTGRSAPRSVAVLRKHGINEAYTLQGGIQGWLQSSLPVKKS